MNNSTPLNDSQLGVYFECMEAPESTMYNIPIAIDLPEGIDADKFSGAVLRTAAVHPALRATFDLKDGTPAMFLDGPQCTVSRTSASSRQDAEDNFIRPFDLKNGPLCRFELCTTPDGVIFLMDIHHLVFDGRSLQLFLGQIADAYEGKDPAPEQVSLAEWNLNGREPETAEANDFWREMLEGVETERPITPDTGKAPAPGAAILRAAAPEALGLDAVDGFARSIGITRGSFFMGAFAYALSVFSGASESLLTMASAGRKDKALDGTVGMFVRTLPLRIAFSQQDGVADYLRKVQALSLSVRENDCIPFPALAAEYGVSAGVSFAYQSGILAGVPFQGGRLAPQLLDLDDCQSDIIFMVVKGADGYTAEIHYRTSLYTKELMDSFCQSVFAVAESMLSAATLSDIRPLSARQREFIARFNATESGVETPATVIPVIDEVFDSRPEATAIVCGGRSYTFARLDALTKGVAAYIGAKGIGADDFVAVLVPRNEYMAIGAWGVIRAGAAFQPLDPTYPRERLEYMVNDSGARLLIADRALLPLLDGFKGDVLFTDEIASLKTDGYSPATPRPQDAITMIYTSGTTGRPKGCVLEHRNLAAFWRNHSGIMGFGPDSRVASYASFGFDAGVMDVVTVPMSGAALYIVPDDIRLDLPAMEEFFCSNGITHAFMTTQLGRMFAQQTSCASLQAFLVGGEKLVPFTPPQGFRFINGYGPCETMGYICHHDVTDDSAVQPIGRPSPDTKLYVADSCGRLLPPGAAGELCIAGCQVGRGYLGLPEKTAEAFVENPFDSAAGYGRMYRTGDFVRLLPSGEIEYIGRRDGQVKIRGFRVELTEVEEVIRRYKGVSDATVAAFDDPAGGKFIAAYVTGPEAIDIGGLEEFILGEKPSYMVPAVTMQIDAIPYTQNQKVNRRALPVPQRGDANREIVPPENARQQQMFDLAAEILGHTDFGITTNLFQAGMTSIGLLKFNAGLGSAFNRAFKIADLRRLGTIRAIDESLASGKEDKTWALQEDYPLMQNQMGVFIDSGMVQDSLDYNIPFLMKLSSAIEPERLRDAVVAAIDAHPYIKATLRSDSEGGVRAVRRDGDSPAVDIVRTTELPGPFQLVKPFQLLESPLYRAEIYNTDAANYLFLDIHHIVADGVSMGILLRDMDVALAGGKPATETFTGYEAALEEEELRSGDRLAAAQAHFQGLLEGAATDCLPGKCPEGGEGGDSASFALDACSEAVQKYTSAHGVSLNAFFNAVFGYTLSEFIHSDDVTYCTIYNGRNDSRLQSSFAMLVKTLPVHCSINPDAKVLDHLRAMQDQLVSTMAADAMSFAEVCSKYGLKPDIFFNYQGDNFIFDSLGGEPAQAITLELGVAKAPLTFELFLENGKFRLQAGWRKDCFCREFLESFVSAFETAALGFTSTETLGQVPLMSESEMAYFRTMNATETPFEDVPAQTFVEREAVLHPGRTAVRTAGASLTFSQLDEMANRLANSLLKMGAQGNEIIGLILERSEYVPVAELGVLKAGCAFLPMLPGYPQERIDYCLKDASCRFCITEENVRRLVEEGSPERPEVPCMGSDLAYCIYTSGSTGTPKGVMIEQHNLSNYIQTGDLNKAIEKGSAILCMASISFDMSISEIFDSLSHGRTAYIASEEEVHNLDKLLVAFKAAGADFMMMTPSFAWSLLSLPEFEATLGQLKAVVLGAEAFQPALLAKLKGLNPEMLVQNGYGPTECTQSCSAKTLEPGGNITIGGPYPNTKFYVMNDRSLLLPRYAVGELVIGGECVGRGYVGLPEKNKAAFIDIDGVRAYRSGDLVRINRDGEAEFGGRKDNQVKLRGFRVELDEIESVMEEFPGVTRSKVILRGSGSDAFLAGFFTASEQVDTGALAAFLKTKLTYYMVPAAMMQLDKMPMTQGGKLDAKALPEIRPATRDRSARRTPKKSLEQRILEEFRSAIGTDDVFVDDNFFEVGGTSLTASKVVMKLKADGLKIEYQDIFDHQSAEELAEHLEPKGSVAATGSPSQSAEDISALTHEVKENRETLKFNTLEYASLVERKPLGDILLTGATGFLGCHILKEMLDSEPGHITCLLRKGRYESVEQRLEGMLFYYFDRPFTEAFAERLTVIEGDITDPGLKDTLASVRFDTLVNCAACVKHYANDDSIEFVNVHGVENLISICRERDARMIQISTTSIPGAHTDETFRRRINMPEDRLFYVDDMNNQYCQSKYKAEQLMLAAIRGGMRGKIIRVGNLMGRHSDGEFQVNTHTNAFLNALRGFVAIGKCPISHATDPMGLSPVDCTARAVVLLAGTNDCFTAFHADNRWTFDEMKLMESVNRCGLKVTPVKDEEYYADFYAMMADARQNEKVSALLTNDRPDVHLVETDNRFTANILYRLGFSWPFIDDAYLDRVISALATLDFFTTD